MVREIQTNHSQTYKPPLSTSALLDLYRRLELLCTLHAVLSLIHVSIEVKPMEYELLLHQMVDPFTGNGGS